MIGLLSTQAKAAPFLREGQRRPGQDFRARRLSARTDRRGTLEFGHRAARLAEVDWSQSDVPRTPVEPATECLVPLPIAHAVTSATALFHLTGHHPLRPAQMLSIAF